MNTPVAFPCRAASVGLSARTLLLLLLAVLLSACASGPKKRIFPPNASVQELRVLDDGRWALDMRVQNFSTVAMRFERIDAELRVGGHTAARIDHTIADSIPPNSAEVVRVEFQPEPAAAESVRAALESRRGVGYRLTGTLSTSEPGKRQDRFEFDSALTPMPGLDGVLR